MAGTIPMEMETIVSKMGLPETENEAQLRGLGRLSDPEGLRPIRVNLVS